MNQISLENFLNQCRNEILQHCIGCGSCIENCEINRFTALKDVNSVHLVEAMKEFIRSGKYERIVYDFAFQCINCLECGTHCPEGIEASLIPIFVKDRLVQEGYEAPRMFKMLQPCRKHSVQDMIGALQVAPSDRWWIDEVPESPQPHDIVLFFGCNEVVFPSAMTATRDIMAHMGLDFVSVAGGKDLCCGASYLNTGDISIAQNMFHRLVESLERFQPKTVLFTCPTCVYILQKAAGENESSAKKYLHFSRFLADRLDEIEFKCLLKKKITLQDPCYTARGLGDYDSPRKVLAAIEGVTLVEMEHNREKALCCGVTATVNNPPHVAEAFISRRLQEAQTAKAETIVSVCSGCQMAFFRHEKEFGLCARSFSEIVAEAMGIDLQPNKMREFLELGDPALILEAARDTIEAGVYSKEEISQILPILFPTEKKKV